MHKIYEHLIRQGEQGASTAALAAMMCRPKSSIESTMVRLRDQHPIASYKSRHYVIVPREEWPVPAADPPAYQTLLNRLYAAGARGLSRGEMGAGFTQRQLMRYLEYIRKVPGCTVAFSRGRHYIVSEVSDYWKVRLVVQASDDFVIPCLVGARAGAEPLPLLDRMVGEGRLTCVSANEFHKVPPTFL